MTTTNEDGGLLIADILKDAHLAKTLQQKLELLILMLSDESFRFHPDLYADEVAAALGIGKADFNRLLGKARTIDGLGFWPTGVEDFVNRFMDQKMMTLRLDGQCRCRRPIDFGNGQVVSFESVMEDMRDDPYVSAWLRLNHSPILPLSEPLAWLQYAHADFGIKYSWSAVQRAFDGWVDRMKRQRLSEIFSEVRCQPGEGQRQLETWKKWASAVVSDEQDHDLTIAVMKSWMWQVKRKMAALDVNHHLMLVFVGPQGGGKSTAVKKLLSPLADGSSTATFSDIEDDRRSELFHWFPALLFDEMEKASRTDVEAIKSRITAETITFRPLYTNVMKVVSVRASCIGTSNRPVSELIQDNTGMRRFFEVQCQERMNWSEINEIDYGKLWKSVDEMAENPITPFLAELRKAQEQLVVRSNVELWVFEGLSESYLEVAQGDRTPRQPLHHNHWYPVGVLFQAFSRWERQNTGGKTGTGRRSFSNRMNEMVTAGHCERREVGRNKIVEYRIVDTSSVIEFTSRTAGE